MLYKRLGHKIIVLMKWILFRCFKDNIIFWSLQFYSFFKFFWKIWARFISSFRKLFWIWKYWGAVLSYLQFSIKQQYNYNLCWKKYIYHWYIFKKYWKFSSFCLQKKASVFSQFHNEESSDWCNLAFYNILVL